MESSGDDAVKVVSKPLGGRVAPSQAAPGFITVQLCTVLELQLAVLVVMHGRSRMRRGVLAASSHCGSCSLAVLRTLRYHTPG